MSGIPLWVFIYFVVKSHKIMVGNHIANLILCSVNQKNHPKKEFFLLMLAGG